MSESTHYMGFWCSAVTVDVETHRKIMASLKASLEKRKAKDGASGGQSSLCTNQEDTLHTLVELKVGFPELLSPPYCY